MKKPIQHVPQATLSVFLLLSLLLGAIPDLWAQSGYRLAEQDSLALVAFYWATDGPNWSSNQPGFSINDLSSEWQITYDGQFNPWFTGPAKDWFGVRVEKRPIANSNDSTYRVTWLWPVIGRRTDGQNLLNGYVPREVGLMTALNHFRINGNDGFTDELMPDELYHPSLEHLDLESCWFGGGLSDEFRRCTSIKKINTRYNSFDYMPNWDFLDEDALRAMQGTQWLYNSRLSYAILEQVIDYFYTISPNIKEFQIEMRDMFEVGDEREIVASVGSAVDIVCEDAGNQSSFITYQWFKNGLSMFGRTDKTLSFPSLSASDYGVYTVRISNDYVKAYDQNTSYGEVFTKEIHLVADPAAPVIERAVSAYNGQAIDLYLSKPMATGILSGYQDLSVLVNNGNNIAITSAEVLGRIDRLVRIQLASPVAAGDTLALSLNTTGNIEDANGGILQAFSSLAVENRVRVAPQLISSATTLDGSGIELYFDQYLSEESLNGASFLVEGDSNTYQVNTINLVAGELDPHISKTILLSLTESVVDSNEQLYTQYLSGNLYGLYAGTVVPTDTLPVLNQVSTDRIPVTLIFEDGSEALENLYLLPSWKPFAFQMFDDGTHSDAVANDHIWTYSTLLAKDEYSWDVLEREEIMAFDTVETIDPITGVVTITLNPIIINDDSLLSGEFLLNFSTGETGVTGDTVYGIQNRDVIFHLRTTAAASEVYLMGIDGDWSVGRLMDEVTPGTLYADTL
ncbi:MAG: immunoglobulin domain-containing protein, partial [Bacteroidota bacterium]